MERLLAALCLFGTLIPATVGFRNGAPLWVCDSMEPSPSVHDKPQTNTAPYNVSCFQSQDDHKIVVEIEGAMEDVKFKGILLEIRDGPSGSSLGKFDEPVDNGFKLACRDSAVTHSGGADKQFGRFTASLDEDQLSKNPHCVVTIVKTQRVHWDRLAFQVDLLPGFESEELGEEDVIFGASLGDVDDIESGNVDSQNGFDTSSFLTGGSFSLGDFTAFLDGR